MRFAWVLSGAMFSVYLGHSILAPVLPPLMRQLGLSELQGGLIMTGSSIMWVIFSPLWGRRSDVKGRKPIFMLGMAGCALGVTAFAIVMQAGLDKVIASATVTWLLLVGARMLTAGLFSAAGATSQAYIADVSSGQQRTSAMGILSAANGLGSIVGPALGVLVVGFGLAAPVFLSAITPLFGLLLVWRLLPAIRPRLQEGARAPRLRFLDARLLPLLIIGFCMMLALSVVQFTLGYLVQDRFGLDAGDTARLVGLAVMVSGAALLFAQTVLIQKLRLTPPWLMRLGMPLMLCSLLVLVGAADFAQIALSMVLLGLGIGMADPGFRSAVTFAVEPHEQGAAAGLASAIPGYGFIFGPALGTAMYGLNPLSPYLFAMLVVLAGIATLALQTRAQRRVQLAT